MYSSSFYFSSVLRIHECMAGCRAIAAMLLRVDGDGEFI